MQVWITDVAKYMIHDGTSGVLLLLEALFGKILPKLKGSYSPGGKR